MSSSDESLRSTSSTDPSSSSKGGGSSRLKVAWLRVKQSLIGVERTDFHSEFLQMLDDAKALGVKAKSIIKAVRQAAQPNSSYQVKLLKKQVIKHWIMNFLNLEINNTT